MVTVNKYLYEDDFGQKICLCSEKKNSIKYYSEKLMKQN